MEESGQPSTQTEKNAKKGWKHTTSKKKKKRREEGREGGFATFFEWLGGLSPVEDAYYWAKGKGGGSSKGWGRGTKFGNELTLEHLKGKGKKVRGGVSPESICQGLGVFGGGVTKKTGGAGSLLPKKRERPGRWGCGRCHNLFSRWGGPLRGGKKGITGFGVWGLGGTFKLGKGISKPWGGKGQETCWLNWTKLLTWTAWGLLKRDGTKWTWM